MLNKEFEARNEKEKRMTKRLRGLHDSLMRYEIKVPELLECANIIESQAKHIMALQNN